jgi:hypothetical protein
MFVNSVDRFECLKGWLCKVCLLRRKCNTLDIIFLINIGGRAFEALMFDVQRRAFKIMTSIVFRT